jgi:molybdopterin converting factor subunit 1
VLFFGMLREIAGRAAEELELPAGARAEDVFEHYARAFPRLKTMESSVALARNQKFAGREEPLADGDEVALLPPVSGGSPCYLRELADAAGNFFALTRERIDAAGLEARVRRDEDGAVVTFAGVVRNQSGGRSTEFLEYECYEPMALQMMAEIGAELARTRPIGQVAMVHRLGRLEIGEASVVIAVGAPHRRPAFEAALEAIDRLKKLVPIWKKEHFADGEVWVEGQWDDSVLPR